MDRFKDQDLRRLASFSFLDQDNSKRYRAIVKVLYDNHQALKSLLYPEDILTELRSSVHFQDYTTDMLDQDLSTLKKWGNIESQQESSKARSIQEFQKKRLRYRASAHTIQIQRFLEDLAAASAEQSGSLELTLFDRFYQSLERLLSYSPRSVEEVHQEWNDVFHYFEKMTRNAQDYLSLLNNDSIEQAIKNQSFLLYKDTFIDYLRDFILKLQHVAGRCEHLLRRSTYDNLNGLIERVIQHRLKLPRLGQEPLDANELSDLLHRRWGTLWGWFCSSPEQQSEWQLVSQATNSAIQRISQFIFQYSERRLKGRSRGEDYLHLAKLFVRSSSLNHSHCLSAVFFGVHNPMHLYSAHSDFPSNLSTWEGTPEYLEIRSRARGKHNRDRTPPLIDRSAAAAAQKKRQIEEKEAVSREISSLLQNRKIRIAELGRLTTVQRRELLSWISGAMKNEQGLHRINADWSFQIIDSAQKDWIVLSCDDGDLRMPNFEILVEQSKK